MSFGKNNQCGGSSVGSTSSIVPMQAIREDLFKGMEDGVDLSIGRLCELGSGGGESAVAVLKRPLDTGDRVVSLLTRVVEGCYVLTDEGSADELVGVVQALLVRSMEVFGDLPSVNEVVYRVYGALLAGLPEGDARADGLLASMSAMRPYRRIFMDMPSELVAVCGSWVLEDPEKFLAMVHGRRGDIDVWVQGKYAPLYRCPESGGLVRYNQRMMSLYDFDQMSGVFMSVFSDLRTRKVRVFSESDLRFFVGACCLIKQRQLYAAEVIAQGEYLQVLQRALDIAKVAWVYCRDAVRECGDELRAMYEDPDYTNVLGEERAYEEGDVHRVCCMNIFKRLSNNEVMPTDIKLLSVLIASGLLNEAEMAELGDWFRDVASLEDPERLSALKDLVEAISQAGWLCGAGEVFGVDQQLGVIACAEQLVRLRQMPKVGAFLAQPVRHWFAIPNVNGVENVTQIKHALMACLGAAFAAGFYQEQREMAQLIIELVGSGTYSISQNAAGQALASIHVENDDWTFEQKQWFAISLVGGGMEANKAGMDVFLFMHFFPAWQACVQSTGWFKREEEPGA